MEFFELVDRAEQLVHAHRRVSRRGLVRQFALDGDTVDEIIDELTVRGVARLDGDVVVATSADAAPSAPSSDTVPAEPVLVDAMVDAEIRNLTVLFCDTVGSTELAASVDSEDWSDAMRRVLETATDAIERFGGHVDSYLGDGLMAYFGYPIAQEDAPERAVRAGLAVLADVRELNASGSLPLDRAVSLRIGVHTGPVVLDQVAGRTQAISRTAHLASRIESAAPADTLVISPETRRLVAGVFVTDDLGPHDLKGFDEPVSLTLVRGVGGLSPRAGSRRSGTAPVLGRDRELGVLSDRWADTLLGRGCIVEVVGEAGIGKSRLVDAFRFGLAEVGHSWLDTVCTPFSRSAPLFPIAELQARGLGFTLDAPPDDKRAAIEAHMANIGLDGQRALDLLTDLHGLDVTGEVLLDSGERRIELFEFMLHWLATLARRQPVVLLIEDLHWADPTTLDFVERLGARAVYEPLLVVVTSRPDAERVLPPTMVGERIELGRLDHDASRQLVGTLAGRDLGDDVVGSIVERCDGVPLFLEELTDVAVRTPDGFQVPSTVQHVLMARLESVVGVRTVAEAASVVGREFSLDDLRALIDAPEDVWRPRVEEAVRHGLFFEREVGGQVEYVFRHALMRDAVYESLVRRRRRALHRAYATTLAELRPALAARRPDLVAEHLTAAGDPAGASAWWQRAGEAALMTASASEAADFYSRAIETCDPADGDRRFELEVARAGTLSSLYGFGHAEVEAAFRHLTELTDVPGSERQHALANTMLAITVAQRDFAECRRAAAVARPIARAEHMDDLEACLESLEVMLGFYEGRPQAEVERAERLIASGARSSDELDRAVGVAVVPMMFAFLGETLTLLGQYRTATEAHEQSYQFASAVGPATRTLMTTIEASSYLQRDDVERFAELSERFIAEARRYDLGYSILIGELTSCCSRLILDPDPSMVGRLDEIQAEVAQGGRILAVPIFGWLIARARFACGQIDVAQETLDLSRLVADMSGQVWINGQLCAFGLQLAQLRGALPADWWESSQAVYDDMSARSLRTSALYLAAQRYELALGGAREDDARAQLVAAYDAIPEPDDSPLLVRARSFIGR